MWRSVPVASIDEDKIQDYLEKQGITSVDDPGIRKVIIIGFSLGSYLPLSFIIVKLVLPISNISISVKFVFRLFNQRRNVEIIKNVDSKHIMITYQICWTTTNIYELPKKLIEMPNNACNYIFFRK